MLVKFWGARGSIPTPDPECMKYGGDTSCVEVRTSTGKILILDAGTGIRRLGNFLMKNPSGPISADILFTHGHWDHIQGFPFFSPAYIPGNKFTLYGLFKADGRVEEMVRGMMGQLYFPVAVDNLASELNFRDILEGSRDMEGLVISTCAVNHPQGAVAYHIEGDGASIVYCPDTEHTDGELQPKLIEFCQDADYLIHDCHFAPEEYADHKGWGHSTYQHAIGVAKRAGVRKLVMFHHAPEHTDEVMDKLVERAQGEWPNIIAATRDLVINPQLSPSSTIKEAPKFSRVSVTSAENVKTYSFDKANGVLRVTCPPSRKVLSSKSFQDEFSTAVDESIKSVSMDLELVDRLNSTSLGTFGKILSICQAREIELEFINVKEHVMEILKVTRFTEVVKVKASAES